MQSAFWQATCNFAAMRCELTCEVQTQATNSDLCMDGSSHQSAVLEMKKVLSLRLRSFYHRNSDCAPEKRNYLQAGREIDRVRRVCAIFDPGR